ncbi:Holliday junction branch migration protein RuvA [Aeromicrobium erythreum]|uniref:Holliday junction branch migration complex subunit RuvA n=1 Tax=Aeromicrobium erythreum TaxID=2041 RepID=A0A0U4CQU2_9ACTN|nr:Holliday junction branch migration protein RuvA [Aeromicrobium erythreum]ALX04988.1 ATP-dependent DNA helicase RuvA [Aeromicrobium erythreum]
MIAHVRGQVAALSLDSAVIDVGGLGHLVHCTPGTIARLRLGEQAQLATTLVVREDSLTLYGFADADERDMFLLVQTASGIGPKVALAMLAVLAPDRLRRAIAESDHAVLTSVPGIGRKGAERIVVELKDRVGPAPVATSGGTGGDGEPWRAQVLEALQSLGWSARDAERAIDAVADSAGDEPDVGQLLRLALRSLSKA